MITIIEAKETDKAIIHNIAKDVWYRTYRFVISQEQMDYMFQRMYTYPALTLQMKEGHTFLLALYSNDYCGFASYYIENEYIKVPKLYVLTSKQGMGVGNTLLNTICEMGQTAGCAALQLNVNRFNTAVGFYLKYGMAIQQVVDIPYHTFTLNDYVMAIAL